MALRAAVRTRTAPAATAAAHRARAVQLGAQQLKQLVARPDCRHPDLREAIAEGWRELLFAEIAPGVHRGEQSESGRRHHLLELASLFGQDDGARRVEHRVEPLEHRVIS